MNELSEVRGNCRSDVNKREAKRDWGWRRGGRVGAGQEGVRLSSCCFYYNYNAKKEAQRTHTHTQLYMLWSGRGKHPCLGAMNSDLNAVAWRCLHIIYLFIYLFTVDS